MLFLSLFSLILIGCTTQEQVQEIEILGELPYVELDPETIKFYPYEGEPNLVFKNQDNEERTLIIRETQVLEVWNFSGNDIQPSEMRRMRLEWDNDIYGNNSHFRIDMNVTATDVGPHGLVDFMLINYSNLIVEPVLKISSTAINIMTSDRGNTGIGYEHFNQKYEPAFQEEIVIGNESFSNVYIGTYLSSELNFFYSKEYGIIGFEDLKDNLWVFSHVE